ncbi:acetyl-CoA synthetase-like protein [Amylostereum chailletii]|nr:acetyl-CoA synthetase-like protein [Amylostereum chailletii]
MIYQTLYPPLPILPDTNYYDFLFSRPEVAQWPDYTVYMDGITGERWMYREFVRRVDNGAGALAGSLGIRMEDNGMVGVLSENCLDYATICCSLLKIAVPYVLFPAFATPTEINALFKLTKVSHLFVSPKLLSMAQTAAQSIGLPQDKIYLLHGRVGHMPTFSSMIDHARANRVRVNTHPIRSDTLAYIVFSSGTSGLPKGVMISHRNLGCSALQPALQMLEMEKVAAPPQLKTSEGIPIGIGLAPMYHAMGFHFYVLRHLLAPATCIIIPRWDTNLVLELIPKHTVTNLFLVPAHVHQLVNSDKFAKLDLSSLVNVGAGAAYLPVDLRERFTARMNIDCPDLAIRTLFVLMPTLGYGMSECTVSAIFASYPGSLGGRVDYIPGMTGVLLPGMEARILRENGTDAAIGEPGELILRGPNVGLGYWNNERATKDTFLPDGWLRTGDRFRADDAGRFFYIDRIKDTLKVSGSQVSPSEIEVEIIEHPGGLITDVAVAGVPGSRMLDEKVPRAWIVLSEKGYKLGRQAVARELDAWVRERLSSPKWVRGGFEVVREIPKSPTGKVLRRKLQEGGMYSSQAKL